MIRRALSTAARAFVESIIWKAEIEGLLFNGQPWLEREVLKDRWREVVEAAIDKHGMDWE